MAENFKFPTGVRPLVLGDSFKNKEEFCTIRYDFRPETEASEETSSLTITDSDQVTLTHSSTSEDNVSQVQYKGSIRPYEKECILIINNVTGEIRLEKLSRNIQLKKTRVLQHTKHTKHHKQKHSKQKCKNEESDIEKEESSNFLSVSRSMEYGGKRSPVNKERLNKGDTTFSDRICNSKFNVVPKHSPLHPSPRRSPDTRNVTNISSPAQISRDSDSGVYNSMTGNSSFSIGDLSSNSDDDSIKKCSSPFSLNLPEMQEPPLSKTNKFTSAIDNTVDTMSSSSSGSSNNSSDSENDSSSSTSSSSSASSNEETNKKKQNRLTTGGYQNGNVSPALTGHILDDDLKLSESETDSD